MHRSQWEFFQPLVKLCRNSWKKLVEPRDCGVARFAFELALWSVGQIPGSSAGHLGVLVSEGTTCTRYVRRYAGFLCASPIGAAGHGNGDHVRATSSACIRHSLANPATATLHALGRERVTDRRKRVMRRRANAVSLMLTMT
jgi:hypothetical protein